jgi:G3E family GTPase
VPNEILLGIGRFDPAKAHLGSNRVDVGCTAPAGHDDEHDATVFSTWSYETDQPLALDGLREAIGKLPGNVYRAKGIIYSTEAPQRRAVLQVVGRRADISIQDEWGDRVPRTQILAIGAAGGMDAGLLAETFASCVLGTPTGG